MTDRRLKIEFETVDLAKSYEYVDKMGKLRLPASVIPEEFWHKVEREGSEVSVMEQFNGLHILIRDGEPVRNVKVYEATVEWVELQPPLPADEPVDMGGMAGDGAK